MKAFSTTVLSEGSHAVTLENGGDRPKADPCERNWNHAKTSCRAPGCSAKAPNMWGTCKAHRKVLHATDWVAVIHRPGGLAEKESHRVTIQRIFDEWVAGGDHYQRFATFIDQLKLAVVGSVEDATALQEICETNGPGRLDQIGKMLRTLVDLHFPAGKHGSTVVDGLPLRVAVANFAAAVCCEEINRGDRWFSQHRTGGKRPSRRAGAYMALGYALLRCGRLTDHEADLALRNNR